MFGREEAEREKATLQYELWKRWKMVKQLVQVIWADWQAAKGCYIKYGYSGRVYYAEGFSQRMFGFDRVSEMPLSSSHSHVVTLGGQIRHSNWNCAFIRPVPVILKPCEPKQKVSKSQKETDDRMIFYLYLLTAERTNAVGVFFAIASAS